MTNKILFLLFYCISFFNANLFALSDVLVVEQLAQRILGVDESKSIKFVLIDEDKEYYQINSNGSDTVIKATTVSALTAGFGYYIKEYRGANISWYDSVPSQFNSDVKEVDSLVSHKSIVKNRFYLNYCTYGYALPFWKWNQWERFIDWMALNGINLPLAMSGNEKVWLEVWKDFGMSENEILSYFTGPAHLGWHRMGNIDKWGGPLPKSYLEGQYKLQLKILARMRAFGMKPVLPAFSGHVPKRLRDIIPDGGVELLNKGWGGFSENEQTFYIQPWNPLFAKVQKSFLKKQQNLYGTDHYYAADPFNEMHPPSFENEFFAKMSDTIYSTLKEVDSDAIWIQMGWMFYFDKKVWTPERTKAFLNAVPKGKLVILDYVCEDEEIWRETESFYGTSFIWNYLGNFGGRTHLKGPLDIIHSKISASINEEGGQNLFGIGLTPEGLDLNQFVYEYVMDHAWSGRSKSPMAEISAHSSRTIGGIEDVAYDKGWEMLYELVYKQQNPGLVNGSLLHTYPLKNGSKSTWTRTGATTERLESLVSILQKFSECSDNVKELPGFQTIFVHTAREAFTVKFTLLYDDILKYNKLRFKRKYFNATKRFLRGAELLADLTAGRKEYSLNDWLTEAVFWASNKEEEFYYINNAKTIITSWGWVDHHLTEYASRSYSGLIETLYLPRWTTYFDFMNYRFDKRGFSSVEANKATVEITREWLNSSEIPNEDICDDFDELMQNCLLYFEVSN